MSSSQISVILVGHFAWTNTVSANLRDSPHNYIKSMSVFIERSKRQQNDRMAKWSRRGAICRALNCYCYLFLQRTRLPFTSHMSRVPERRARGSGAQGSRGPVAGPLGPCAPGLLSPWAPEPLSPWAPGPLGLLAPGLPKKVSACGEVPKGGRPTFGQATCYVICHYHH